MSDRFLKAKHWQLFVLTFGIPMIFQFILIGSVISDFAVHENPDPAMMFKFMNFIVIVPLHLFAMFCIFYSLYFVSKTFKTVELQREVKFGDFAVEFFMIWFYPVGIWIVQPKINKMVEDKV